MNMSMIHCLRFVVLLAVTLAVLSGCHRDIFVPTIGVEAADTLPRLTYSELREQHAETRVGLDQFWSRATVEVNWTDSDGDRHYEQGDGPLIWRRPHDLAWTIGKLGQNRFWIGSDQTRYWFLDLGRPRSGWVGSHRQVTDRKVAILPIPIRPDRLPMMLGLTPLPEPGLIPPVRSERGLYIVTVPMEAGTLATFYVEPDSWQLVRIVLRDRRGQRLVESTLEQWQPIEETGSSIPTRITIEVPPRDAIARLTVESPTDGRRRIRDRQFDLGELQKALRVDELVDLDQQ